MAFMMKEMKIVTQFFSPKPKAYVFPLREDGCTVLLVGLYQHIGVKKYPKGNCVDRNRGST